MLPLEGCADAADVAARVRYAFGWGAQLPLLHLLPDEPSARHPPRPVGYCGRPRCESLFASDAVLPGSWLLARVPPALAPGASRR